MISTLPFSRRLIAPEVIQTSEMDCGPASLKCVLEGYGTSINYGRLRDACRADVDGTSIDTLEQVAEQLGLEAEQTMMPADHLHIPEAKALPAMLVILQPNGTTHFVVIWRRCGQLLQVMDPAIGTRWLSMQRLREQAYIHSTDIPADMWYRWAQQNEFRMPLKRRLVETGFQPKLAATLIDQVLEGDDWKDLARLDAATRLVRSLISAGGIRRGRQSIKLLRSFASPSREATTENDELIPDNYWSVRPTDPAEDGEEEVSMKGVVLVRILGRKQQDTTSELEPELKAALAKSPKPGRHLIQAIWKDGWFSLSLLLLGLLITSGSVVFEGLLLRGMMNITQNLVLVEQRLQSLAVFLVFIGTMALIEWQVAAGLMRLGRLLETSLRINVFEKVPVLGDRYFQTRPISDLVERCHKTYFLRWLPWLCGETLQTGLRLLLTAAAICWLEPTSVPIILIATVMSIGLPFLFKPHLEELDLRVRTHSGALCRFYLDTLVGLVSVRAYSSERTVRRVHEGFLVDWARVSYQLVKPIVVLETLVSVAGFGLAGCLLLSRTSQGSDISGSLLLAFWVLQIPVLGEQLASQISQFPQFRNLTLRLLDPLEAQEEPSPSQDVDNRSEVNAAGVAIEFKSASVHVGSNLLLDEVSTTIPSGSHLAVVGPSGSGKSSLAGVLLGWNRPTAGQVLIDGKPIDATVLDQLRKRTAWVDPSVHLWNQSMVQNLLYNQNDDEGAPLSETLKDSDLYEVIPRLSDGLQTRLGESGSRLSGGQGQRVRFARALRCENPRLVILDEPFRGLDRQQRQLLLQKARQHWKNATLICITHDVSDTAEFERVMVIESAQIVEDGSPVELAKTPGSRYRDLHGADIEAGNSFDDQSQWRRLRLRAGTVLESTVEQGT